MQQPRFRGCSIVLRYRARVESDGKLLYNLGNYLVSKKEKTEIKSEVQHMRLTKVQDALQKKKIKYEYTEVDNCGSLDFLFRGLKFHVWEYEDKVWGAETNVFEAGRSQDIEGDYEEVISKEILSWPDMLA